MTTRPNRWPKAAQKLGELIPREALQPEVTARLAAAGRRKWIVAVSGGADSVALLLLLWAHWPQQRDRLVLAHFDHALRGRASRADSRFCARLAAGLQVEFEPGTWDDAPSDPSEGAARDVRVAFLDSVRRRHRARWIFTGHHADDVAETMLMRLARGSGSAGLAAPRPVQTETHPTTVRLRPLLPLRAAAIRQALTMAGATWREDRSNSSDRFFRNRVRHQVVVGWQKAARRDAVGGALRSRALLDEDDTALNQWLREVDPFDGQGRLNLKALAGKPTAIWRRALRQWLSGQADGGDLSRAGFEDLLRLATEGRTSRFSLGKSGFARIRRGWLFFEQPFAD